jgi:hypothetical protein
MGSPTAPPQRTSVLLDGWLRGRASLPQALRRSFGSLVLLVSSSLRKERNSRTFERRSTTVSQLVTDILEEAGACVGAGYSSLALLTALIA